MSMQIRKKHYWSKRDQYKTYEYVYIVFNVPGSYPLEREQHSCGEVHKPKTWVKAEAKLREIFERKLQHALRKLYEEKSNYQMEV